MPFKTKYGQSEFLLLPMGLRKDPAKFQPMMTSILSHLIEELLVPYLDGIFIYRNNRKKHLRPLKTVLERLMKNELYIGSKKFQLMTTETELLGLNVGREGMSIGDEKKGGERGAQTLLYRRARQLFQ